MKPYNHVQIISIRQEYLKSCNCVQIICLAWSYNCLQMIITINYLMPYNYFLKKIDFGLK